MGIPVRIARLCRAGALFGLSVALPAAAQDSADLAVQLANPVASLISVPFQFNVNSGYGPEDGALNHERAAGRPVQPLGGLEPDLAHDPAGDRPG
jgi:hypothetical protein